MSGDKTQAGDKTHAHRQRQIADGVTSQDQRSDAQVAESIRDQAAARATVAHSKADDGRPVGQHAPSHQESGHNKHNNSGQEGHGPQEHGPGEEGA